MPRINFAEVKGMELLPAGRYSFEVVAAKDGTSGAGNDKINIRVRVISGEYEGRQIFEDLTFAPTSEWKVKEALLAMGYNSDYDDEVVADELVGLVFDGDVIQKVGDINKHTGERYPTKNRIAKYYTPGEVSLEDLI
jgi:hypothetical protein